MSLFQDVDYHFFYFIYTIKEDKFKLFYAKLHWSLMEYDRIVTEVIPVTAMILVSKL